MGGNLHSQSTVNDLFLVTLLTVHNNLQSVNLINEKFDYFAYYLPILIGINGKLNSRNFTILPIYSLAYT